MTRANTPASVSFRRFLPFSSWRAPARLRLKSQKSLVNSSLAGALQFCRSRNVTRQGKTRREYCRILKGLDAVWGHFCPSKPCLPLLIDGTVRQNKNREPIEINRFAVVRREGFEPPAFWPVGCLTHKSESFQLRFVIFATVRWADFPLFPPSPARSNSILGQSGSGTGGFQFCWSGAEIFLA